MSKFVWIYKMSLKRKDYQQQQLQQQGLRVAAGEPHLVSLGGGRLSTAVTIHHLPIGDLTIGSSPACGVVINGTGVLPVHCTVYRAETDAILLVPEPEGRTLVDGNRVTEEVNLRQGAMLTIGKANYMRFNNPTEAELIKSTMGSNERISMPQLDFTSNDSSPTAEDDENRNILNNKFVESQASKSRVSELLEKFTRNEFGGSFKKGIGGGGGGGGGAEGNHNHHPPTMILKDSVNGKFSGYTKNLNQNANNYANGGGGALSGVANGGATKLGSSNGHNNGGGGDILSALNNLNGLPNSTTTNGHSKVQNSYDRYPKSRGGLQVFPMNGINEQINNNGHPMEPQATNGGVYHNLLESQRQKAQVERLREQEVSRAEQDRLEEILQLCAEYERQNSSSSNMTASPIVQNRIKTNGSLPRDKKSPFGSEMNSPFSSDSNKNGNIFFPSDLPAAASAAAAAKEQQPKRVSGGSSGYENVSLIAGMRRVEIANRYENVSDVVGDTHEYPLTPKKYVPQSPRTKIRTNCQASPKTAPKSVELERKAEYELLMRSFEERQLIEDNQKYSEAERRILTSVRLNGNGTAAGSNGSGSVERADGKSLVALKKSRNEVLKRVRELKTQIADLQRAEDEVLRELDMEKALVSGELATEKEQLYQMEMTLAGVQQQIHRMEAQRKANRVMQETQQKKLQQTIEIKENQVSGLEKLYDDNPTDKGLQEQLDDTIGSMENDKKMFEDLEFQYLEEETDWLSAREELHSEVKQLAQGIEEKRTEIMGLENQRVKDQDMACTDTKVLEKSLFNLLKDLERAREELRTTDKRIFEMGSAANGKGNDISDSEDEDLIRNAFEEGQNEKNLMSNSLFGSEEVLKQRGGNEALMSKSMNENFFFNNLETPDFSSTPKKGSGAQRVIVDISEDITSLMEKNHERLKMAETEEVAAAQVESTQSSPSPPPHHHHHHSHGPLEKSQSMDLTSPNSSKLNLNLSLEGDEFEVNPMIERVPSQDDIDRISKVTSDAPISTQGASYKLKESIKEIERHRQLLLAQQGSHVIEHERQKMNELKKKSHDEARAQYLRLQSTSRSDSESSQKNESFLEGDPPKMVQLLNGGGGGSDDQKQETNQRHSHPDFGDGGAAQQQLQQHLRPLSEAGSEQNYDADKGSAGGAAAANRADKPFKSTNDIFASTGHAAVSVHEVYRSSGGLNNGLSNNNPDLIQDSSHRNSGISTHSGCSSGSNVNASGTSASNTDSLSRLVSGARRNLPKVQRPLTRYLPIMSVDLDLKQHIESAGHQISLCPHVTVDSTSCRGYLHKLGATFHGWSRRWFVLDRKKGALIYYSDKAERKPRGGSYFTTIDEVYLDHMNMSKSGRPHCTFIVKTKKRSYHLQAASDAAARIWIDAIITGAQGNMDYL